MRSIGVGARRGHSGLSFPVVAVVAHVLGVVLLVGVRTEQDFPSLSLGLLGRNLHLFGQAFRVRLYR